MNLDTLTTTPCPASDPGSSRHGIRIGHLDDWQTAPQGGSPGEARILWVSLVDPRSLLGPLLDETSFEGAWLGPDGHARIRLAGMGETLTPAPLFHSPQSARAWLASQLSARFPDSQGPSTHTARPAVHDRLAA